MLEGEEYGLPQIPPQILAMRTIKLEADGDFVSPPVC